MKPEMKAAWLNATFCAAQLATADMAYDAARKAKRDAMEALKKAKRDEQDAFDYVQEMYAIWEISIKDVTDLEGAS